MSASPTRWTRAGRSDDPCGRSRVVSRGNHEAGGLRCKGLPQRTKYYFDQFAHTGGAWNWHPKDVERFCTFIHAAHKGRDLLRESPAFHYIGPNRINPRGPKGK